MTCPNCGKEIKPEESTYLGERTDHLWDEWKDRHESWSRMFTRWLWVVGVLALFPFTNFSWLKPHFYVSIYEWKWLYGLLLIVLFLATNAHLVFEYASFKSLEDRLKGFGVSHDRTWCKIKRAFGFDTIALYGTFVYAVIYAGVLAWVFLHYPPPK